MNNLVRSFPWPILLAFYIASGDAADLSTPESGESPLLKQPPGYIVENMHAHHSMEYLLLPLSALIAV
ncbi:MAG: hypothetical protein AAF194_09475, partial [Pseudomonadota bacterium]